MAGTGYHPLLILLKLREGRRTPSYHVSQITMYMRVERPSTKDEERKNSFLEVKFKTCSILYVQTLNQIDWA